jgi:hypothetical protein
MVAAALAALSTAASLTVSSPAHAEVAAITVIGDPRLYYRAQHPIMPCLKFTLLYPPPAADVEASITADSTLFGSYNATPEGTHSTYAGTTNDWCIPFRSDTDHVTFTLTNHANQQVLAVSPPIEFSINDTNWTTAALETEFAMTMALAVAGSKELEMCAALGQIFPSRVLFRPPKPTLPSCAYPTEPPNSNPR